MQEINEIIKKYELKPRKYTKNKKVLFIETQDRKYRIKEKIKDNQNIYDYLKSRNFNYLPKIISSPNDEYEITEYIESYNIPEEQKIIDLIDLVALLHNKTTHYKEVTEDDYKEIYEDLKEKIETEVYPKDSYLPSEHTLIDIYKCSRNTVRRAIAQLADEGYLQSMHGKGVLIIWQPPLQSLFSLSGIESLQEAAARNNMSYRTKVVHFAELEINERLHKRTGFPVGETVYYIQRVRYFDDEAYILDHNYFLKSTLPGLTKEIAEKSIYEYMEKTLNISIATTSRMLTVEPMTQVDEKFLDMKDYNCLAVVTSQTYNGSGVMFEYTVSRHRPDKFVFYTTARR